MERSRWSERFLGGSGCENLRFDPMKEVSVSGKRARDEESLGRGMSECWGVRW